MSTIETYVKKTIDNNNIFTSFPHMKINCNTKFNYTREETLMKHEFRRLKRHKNLTKSQKKHNKFLSRKINKKRNGSNSELCDKINGFRNATEKLKFIKTRKQKKNKRKVKTEIIIKYVRDFM